MEESPVVVTELLQLTQLGIPLEHITWPRVTMTSDQWICIRHGKQGRSVAQRNVSVRFVSFRRDRVPKKRASYITVMNPCRADFPQTWQTFAGSVIMNPCKPIMAVKAGRDFQVYHLDTRQLVHRTRVNSRVVFWCWISDHEISLVTEADVLHWDLQKDKCQPHQVFSRHTRLSQAAVVNYAVDASSNWHAVVALTVEDNRILGITQIYSVEHDLAQPIEAHAVAFCCYLLPGNQHPSTLLVTVVREQGNTGKIHVIELGPHIPGNQAPTRHSGDLTFEDDWEKYDFPVSVQISTKLGLVFVITKYGQLHLCDLETCQLLSTTRICADILFVAALTTDGQGVLTISRNGQVLLIGVKAVHIAHYIRHSLQRPLIAERLEKVLTGLTQMSLLKA